MRHLLLALFCIHGIVCAFAEDGPGVNVLEIGEAKKYDIPGRLSRYIQGSAEVSPELAFRYFEAGKFQPVRETNNEYINDGLVNRRSWVAIRLYNTRSYESSLVLEYILSDINSVECYVVNEEQRVQPLVKEPDAHTTVSGGLLAKSATFNLNLQPGEGVLLLMHLTNNGQLLYVPAKLYDLNYFDESASDRHNFFGIFQGIFFFIIIFNLLLYFTTFDRIYLLYLLYALFISVFALNEVGTATYSLAVMPFLGYFSGQTYLFAGFSVWLLLMLQFLNVTKNSRSLYRSTHTLAFVDLFIAFIPYILSPFHWNHQASFQEFYQTAVTILFAANLLLIIVANLLRIVSGSKLAIFYAVANIPVVAGSIVYYGNYYNFTNIRFGWLNPVALGLSIETFLISFGFAYRYNLINKEKQRLLLHINEQQRATTRQIIDAQELEQKRIAEDLHDELGGNLAAIKMTVQSFRLKEEESQWLSMLIDRASAKARAIAHNLMPPEFGETTLKDLLSSHFGRLDQEGDIAFHFLHSGDNIHFIKQDELIIYRIIMELTNNCIRHSYAPKITLQLIYHADQLSIMVEDNGRGFSHLSTDGMGLKNVRSRVNYLGGILKIDSGANGTTIMIELPYKQAP